jgi:hypothetical protein
VFESPLLISSLQRWEAVPGATLVHPRAAPGFVLGTHRGKFFQLELGRRFGELLHVALVVIAHGHAQVYARGVSLMTGANAEGHHRPQADHERPVRGAEASPGAPRGRGLFDRWFDGERRPGTRPFFAQQRPSRRGRISSTRAHDRSEASEDDAKETAAGRWIAAVNADRRWGLWSYAVVRAKAEVRSTIDAAFAVASMS